MSAFAATLVTLATVVAMEGVAWGAHRYIMHGWGWGWHRSHHEPHGDALERNDLYAIVFGIVAIGLFVYGSRIWPPLFWIAAGMTIYGLFYAFVHDGLVHQRWPFRHHPRNAYLRRLVQAHRLHHVVEGRERCVSYGFLYAPPVRSLKKRLQHLHPHGFGGEAVD